MSNNLGLSLKRSARDFLYDRLHRRKARAAFSTIVSQYPECRPNAETQAEIRQYSQEVLGSRRFEPWLNTYTAYRGRFHEGWIPDNFFGRIVVPISKRGYAGLGAKTLARRLLATDRIPDIAYHVNGSWNTTNGTAIPATKVAGVIFADTDTVFIKADRSACGVGVIRVDHADFNLDTLTEMGNFVVQKPIRQIEFFNQITPDSTATLRITTVKAGGNPAEKRAAYLRVGLAGDILVTAKSSLRIPVVDDNGTLGADAALPSWERCQVHPGTGFVFAGKVIPEFDRAVSVCTELHDRVPHLLLIGWDVSIDSSGEIILMEWNTGHSDIKFSEATTGPCFCGLGWESLRAPMA